MTKPTKISKGSPLPPVPLALLSPCILILGPYFLNKHALGAVATTPALPSPDVLAVVARTAALLLLLVAIKGFTTATLRIAELNFSTPEDYKTFGFKLPDSWARGQPDPNERIARWQRAHRNDGECIPYFLAILLVSALVSPDVSLLTGWTSMYVAMRALHTASYVWENQQRPIFWAMSWGAAFGLASYVLIATSVL